MALTLNDYLKQAKRGGDAISAAIIEDLIRDSQLMDQLTFKPISGLSATGTRWQSLPSVAFRKIGAGYTESTGRTEQIKETLSILGGDILADTIFEHVKDVIEDPIQTQMKLKAKAMARVFNDYFVNGDQASDPDGFEGIKKRISNMPARQTIDLYNTLDASDGLIVFEDAAHEHLFIDTLHKAKKYCEGATHVFCNETTWLGLGQVARRLNLYQQITDALGKTWDTIAGLKFIDVGLKSDLSTEIITSTEDPGDGGSDSTSIYLARIDNSDGLHGIQLSGTSPMAYDPLSGGEKESGPQKLRRIDWAVGLANLSQHCLARIKGFRFAAT